ncbi:MAG: hypothetical protein ABI193_10210 [Minicystis sp.]
MLALGALSLHCGSSEPPSVAAAPVEPEAGFLDVPAREVTLKGKSITIAAEARLFYNLLPADEAPETKPILVFFNGFAAEIVRAFGTGKSTVAEGGAVIDNPATLTRFANLLYVDPRQAGYSYDLLDRPPEAQDCNDEVFNEYVDAADVLLAVLRFVEVHPQLAGPIYWAGESYGGARIQWILAYLRGRGELASYDDPLLFQAIAAAKHPTSLRAGQILLEPWLAGRAHTEAITAVCADVALLGEVSATIGEPCVESNACACADHHERSRYNYGYGLEHQAAREREASLAHTVKVRAEALLGLPLSSIPLLGAKERGKGFKCSPADDETPSDAELVALLGALPEGQSYYVPYSPLLPGKETAPSKPDWRNKNLLGVAFADNLEDVPAFLTDGPRDLVVPTRALAPALSAILGSERVDASSPGEIRVKYPSGARVIPIATYPTAGHMVTMIAPEDFARDLGKWLEQQRSLP